MINSILSTISLNSSDKAIVVLLWLLIVVGILLFAAMVFSVVTKIIVATTYKKYNKIECQKKVSAYDLTQQNLQFCNLPNVQVKKASWLRSLLGFNVQSYGNSYSAYKKTIFLRKNIIDKASITAIAVSTQKVGHAVMDAKKENNFYYKVKPLMPFAPILMIPIVIIGVILDLAFYQTLGLYTLIFAIASFAIFTLSFVILLITIPIEKKANKHAIEILQQTNFATPEELNGMKKVHDAYILSYVSDFIYAILQIVWDILRMVLKVVQQGKLVKK